MYYKMLSTDDRIDLKANVAFTEKFVYKKPTKAQQYRWLEVFYDLKTTKLLENIDKVIAESEEISAKQPENLIKQYMCALKNLKEMHTHDSQENSLTVTERYTRLLEAVYEAERIYLKSLIKYYKRIAFPSNESQ